MSDPALPQSPSTTVDTSFDRERERIHRQMLSSVSHDLKTPLASIIGSLEVFTRMHEQLSPEKRTTLISVALQEAYRLDAFISNILDMARLENSAVKSKQESVEIGPLLRNCLTRMENYMRGATINILPMGGEIVTMTDAVLFSRAIGLVLDNAVKYGGKPPMITVKFGEESREWGYISIHDNGSGIPESQIENIFSKYTRFAREDQQNAGTGLGLAIAREILRLLQGRITAANHPDGGAVFTLHFPIR
ncbi:MAG: ATP-binding protein [Pseudomonadota bacterium]|nr:ATP-binding protein [Pseudomonadota bacterium]